MNSSSKIKDKQYRYKAFISYAHHDIKFAKYLKKSIENYKIPNKLRNKYASLPHTLKGSIYFSKEELNTSNILPREIKAALKFSENILVVCSHNSRKSRLVYSELNYFKQEHGHSNILAVVKDGKVPDILPLAIYENEQNKIEPFTVFSTKNENKREALLRVIAFILEVDVADLLESDKPIKNRAKNRIILLLGIFVILAIYVYKQYTPKLTNEELKIVNHEISLLENQLSSKDNSEDEIDSLSTALTQLQEFKKVKKDTIKYFNSSKSTFLKDGKLIYDKDGSTAALTFFDSYSEKLEKEIEARKNLIEAKIYIEKGNLEKANTFYEKAVNIHVNFDNIYSYALFLIKQNKITKAEMLLEELLEVKLPADNKADALNLLASLYSKSAMFDKAEKNYIEAISIREELVREDAVTYNSDLAWSYNNLAILYEKMQKYKDSEEMHLNALNIRKELSKNKTEEDIFNLSSSFYDLGRLHRINKKFEDSKMMFEKSLKIRRDLVEKNPKKYTPYLVNTLDELALLYTQNDAAQKAETIFNEALEIRRKLYLNNTLKYSMAYYDTLTNFYTFLKNTKQDLKADTLYKNSNKY
ncbi:Kinesin light chain [hydrothermal vent metagenome]|uniref:Kinesin light chain n=1 Tax=hydrothermal vent metagenome TaxID=652676 RepID=A0A1W1ECL0_9ZZZZ